MWRELLAEQQFETAGAAFGGHHAECTVCENNVHVIGQNEAIGRSNSG